MKLVRISVTALLLCVVFACNEANKSELNVADVATTAQYKSEDNKSEYEQAPAADTSRRQAPQPNTSVAMDWEKKIIKNADLNIEVTDYNAYNTQVHSSVKKWGGYIATEVQQASEYQKANNITIKVPVDQFDNIVQALTSGNEKVHVKKITSEDVTGEVVDTRARMDAKRQIRQRYMDLLKQAKNMEEILQVQTVIDDIQVQLEAGAGRIGYLTHASAYSTIQLNFFQVLDAGAVNNHEPSYGTQILNSLSNGLDWMGKLLLVLLNLWPLGLFVGIIYWGFKKWRPAKAKANN